MNACGTVAGYTAHRRANEKACQSCRDAIAEYQRSRRGHRRAESTAVLCTVCRREIEGCDGLHGEWMHSESRRERAADGHLARPEQAA